MPAPSILLVEDDDRVRELFRLALKQSGFHVITARDGVDALRLLDEGRPSLIVLDLGLPTLSGSDVVKDLSSRVSTRTIPVVVVTGLDATDVEGKVSSVLHKPVDPDVVVREVRRHVAAPPMSIF